MHTLPGWARVAVTSGPLQQGTDPGLIAQRGAPRAAGRARLPSGDPSWLRRELGELRSEWSGMAALAQVTGRPPPARPRALG